MTRHPDHAHSWNLSPAEAVGVQRGLAGLVREEPLSASPRTIAGIDVSVRDKRVRAAVVVVAYPDLAVVEESVVQGDVVFPYVPGLLSFREIPAILPALEKLRTEPDLFITDGHGRAHPRRFGIAAHLGVLLGKPAFGVAKTRLVGRYEEPLPAKGSVSPLMDQDEQIGAVLRTRDGVRPVFVSVGHRITLPEAVELALACAPRYRIPEPTRLAHRLSKTSGPY